MQLINENTGGNNTDNHGIFIDNRGGSGASYSLRIKNNASEILAVKADGNVGIGVTSPLSPLHQINSGSSSAGEIRVGGSATAFGIKIVYDQDSSTTGTIYASPNYTNSNAVLKLGCGNGNTDQLVLKGIECRNRTYWTNS